MEPVETTTRPSGFMQRLLGAAAFRIPIYEEIEHDRTATPQAAGVVGLVAVASALAGVLAGARGGGGGLEAALVSLVAGLVSAYLGWALWSGTCYLVGTKLFEGTADWGELLRTIGFAQAPGILLLVGAVPNANQMYVQLAVYGWMIATVLVAIRQALDFNTGRALATALAGFVPYVLGQSLIELLLGITPRMLP